MTRLLVFGTVLWSFVLVCAVAASQSPPVAPARTRASTPDPASLFRTSDDCVACHNSLTSPAGEDVSIGTMWRSTMMGNSARDPYFQAGVRRETIDHPTASADIQDECAGCHMPMLQRLAHAQGRKADLLAQLPIQSGSELVEHRLAADSVSCTVCHQVASDNLGTRASFNGQFTLAPPQADGRRQALGPFRVDSARTRIMHSVTSFAQAEAPHLRQSELCASCHTLYTQALGANGEVLGELPEQMNFQEWQHSAFNAEQRSCQSCHMPRVDGPTRIASVLGEEREGLSRHLFVGGNFFMVRMLNRFRGELGVEALPAEFEATASATIRQLQQETATLSVAATRTAAGKIGRAHV